MNWLAKEPARFGLPFQLVGINLDEELGPGHWSDGAQAQRVIGLHSRMPGLVLADCGAGQLAFASDFREYVLSNIRACVAVWCDTNTFRTRHSSETVEREIANNYRRELQT
ncbi:MAG: hypothetical protein ACRD2A_11045, partial [Vicinamibacterales bacterium]